MLFATLLAALLQTPVAYQPALPPILMYHRVDAARPRDQVGRTLTVTPDAFEQQIAYLRSQGLAVISMEQLYRRLASGRDTDRTVVVTFDDGYSDQYRYALPILRRNGAAATFYVIGHTVGRRGHLTWPELRGMANAGMDIAAHGMDHNDLSKMPSALQERQIDDSVDLLRSRLNVPVDSYAYPSGRFNRETLYLVSAAKVTMAVTTDPRYVIHRGDMLELTRIRVRGGWGLAQFARALRLDGHPEGASARI